MKPMKIFAIFAIAFLLSYLGASFVSWEFNPGAWSAFSRCNTIVAAGVMAWVSIGVFGGLA